MKRVSNVGLVLCLLTIFRLHGAVGVLPEEMTTAEQWAAASFTAEAPNLPFSFVYGGQPSAALLKDWELKRASRPLDPKRTEHTLTWADSKTGL